MPRRTPVRELQQEEAVPNSPLRRSSRISASSPVPTKVISRRNSASETSTSTPKVATRGRRSSFNQEADKSEADKKNTKAKEEKNGTIAGEEPASKPRTRRSSVTKSDTPQEVKKATTRRTRSESLEPETKIEKSEDVEDAKKPSEKSVTTPVNEIVEEPESGTKKKTDFDLSIINETSLTEEEGTPQKKQKLSFTEEDKIAPETEEKTKQLSPVKEQEEKVEDSIPEKRISKSPTIKAEEKMKSVSPVVKLSRDSSVEKHYEKEKTPAKPMNVSLTKKSEEEIKNLSPIIMLTKDSNVEELVQKEKTPAKSSPENLFSNSESSFSLQLSASVFENSDKAESEVTKSPLSNKENVRPAENSKLEEIEPMEVDEFEISVTETIKTDKRKSLEIGKKLEDAEKSTDKIAENLSEEIRSSTALKTHVDNVLIKEKSLDDSIDKKSEKLEENGDKGPETVEEVEDIGDKSAIVTETEEIEPDETSSNNKEEAKNSIDKSPEKDESFDDLHLEIDVDEIEGDAASIKANSPKQLENDKIESAILIEESPEVLENSIAAEEKDIPSCDNEKVEDIGDEIVIEDDSDKEIDITNSSSACKNEDSNLKDQNEEIIIEDNSEDSFITNHEDTYQSPIKKPGIKAAKLDDSITSEPESPIKANDSTIIIKENVIINKSTVEDIPNKLLSQSLTRKSVDKTSIVMQENVKAGDNEKSLSDRIHKVVDIFCAGLKNNVDVSLNVSLEYKGQVSDEEHERANDVLEVSMSATTKEEIENDKQIVEHKGSKRRKISQQSSDSEPEIEDEVFVSETSPTKKKNSSPKASPKKKKNEELEASLSKTQEMESFVDLVDSESDTTSDEEIETDEENEDEECGLSLFENLLSITLSEDERDNTWEPSSLMASVISSDESDDSEVVEETVDLSTDDIEEVPRNKKQRKLLSLTNFMSESLMQRPDLEETKKTEEAKKKTTSKKTKKLGKKQAFVTEKIADMVPQKSETQKQKSSKKRKIAVETFEDSGVENVQFKKTNYASQKKLKPTRKSSQQRVRDRGGLKPSTSLEPGWDVQMLS